MRVSRSKIRGSRSAHSHCRPSSWQRADRSYRIKTWRNKPLLINSSIIKPRTSALIQTRTSLRILWSMGSSSNSSADRWDGTKCEFRMEVKFKFKYIDNEFKRGKLNIIYIYKWNEMKLLYNRDRQSMWPSEQGLQYREWQTSHTRSEIWYKMECIWWTCQKVSTCSKKQLWVYYNEAHSIDGEPIQQQRYPREEWSSSTRKCDYQQFLFPLSGPLKKWRLQLICVLG